MTTKKAAKATTAKASDMVALTLKVDGKTYERLSTLRAKQRMTAQEMLTEALHEYLTRKHA